MSDEQTFVTAQVPTSLKQGIERIAERDDRTVSWVIRQALKNHVANFGTDHTEKAAA